MIAPADKGIVSIRLHGPGQSEASSSLRSNVEADFVGNGAGEFALQAMQARASL